PLTRRPLFLGSDHALPPVGRMTDGHLAAIADERRAQQARLGQRTLEQPLRRVERHAQAHVFIRRAILVDHGRGPEAIGESLQLALGRGTLLEIDEVHRDPALGEEAKRFARLLAILKAEYLNVYCSGLREAGSLRGWPALDTARLRLPRFLRCLLQLIPHPHRPPPL